MYCTVLFDKSERVQCLYDVKSRVAVCELLIHADGVRQAKATGQVCWGDKCGR